MFDSIFVIRKAESNDLVFYGQLSDTPVEDLETVLGQILMKAQSQPSGTRKLLALKQGKFLYGIYEEFYLISALSKGTDKDVADRILRKLGDAFSEKYQAKLAGYAGDNAAFTGFSADVQAILSESVAKKPAVDSGAATSDPSGNVSNAPAAASFSAPYNTESSPVPPESNSISSSEKAEMDQVFGDGGEQAEKTADTQIFNSSESAGEAPSESVIPLSQRKAIITIEKSKAVSDSFSADKPLIAPQKRQAYPDGIPDYMRDEVLFNESFEVQKNFECDLVNYSVSDIKINMNVALTHMYEIEIDFTNYPDPPQIILPDTLKQELGAPIEQISYFLRNWDPKIPPHITEIVYELEKILTRYKSEGKLTATQEVPGYVLPELEPLKNDIKWDPNYKPPKIVVPPPAPSMEEIAQEKKDQQAPAVVKPMQAPTPSSPQKIAPQEKIDPKKQKELEKKRAEEEKIKQKNLEKQRQMEQKAKEKEEKEKAAMRKQLEKMKKEQAKEDKMHQKIKADDDEDDEI
jgi:hypothetical protein